jgi:excisionase family DNA binding protein
MTQRLDKLLAADDVANALGITIYAARKRMQRGQLPAVKMGRQWRVKQSALQAYIAGLPTNTRQEPT